MEIGGHDMIIHADREVPVNTMILHRVRKLWPEGVFQDAESEELRDFDSSFLVVKRCREFFLYRNRAAAEAWLRDGATPANQSTMIHVIIEDSASTRPGREVTVVIGERSPQLLQLVQDLVPALRNRFALARMMEMEPVAA